MRASAVAMITAPLGIGLFDDDDASRAVATRIGRGGVASAFCADSVGRGGWPT